MISFSSEQKFIVTGASSGIGEGVALLLNELGASIIAIGRNEERLSALKQKAKYPENMFLEQKDLIEDIDELSVYVKSLKEKYGKFSGMAYCAGITLNKPMKMSELSDYQSLFSINYFVPMLMGKAMADKRNNVGSGTSLVFISGCSQYIPPRALGIYSGAKAALTTTIRTFAKETAPSGIRINSVSPSDIVTPMTEADPDILNSKINNYPMGFGKVSDVANVVAFLLSNKSRWLTGHDYIVDCASF